MPPATHKKNSTPATELPLKQKDKKLLLYLAVSALLGGGGGGTIATLAQIWELPKEVKELKLEIDALKEAQSRIEKALLALSNAD
jgi:hydrogenase maturation factor HypE